VRNIPDVPSDGWFWHDLDVSLLSWLQAWYMANCDDDWEHQYGVKIQTIGNPGRSVSIELDRTPLDGSDFERVEVICDANNWLLARVEGNTWQFDGGPLNLSEGLYLFRDWAQDRAARSGLAQVEVRRGHAARLSTDPCVQLAAVGRTHRSDHCETATCE
jgi:hypothetical protein